MKIIHIYLMCNILLISYYTKIACKEQLNIKKEKQTLNLACPELAGEGYRKSLIMTKRPEKHTQHIFEKYVEEFYFSPNGKYLAVLLWDNILQLFDITKQSIEFSKEIKCTKKYRFSLDSKYLGLILWDNTFQLLHLNKQEFLLELAGVKDFKFCKNSNLIAILFNTDQDIKKNVKKEYISKKHILELFDIRDEL